MTKCLRAEINEMMKNDNDNKKKRAGSDAQVGLPAKKKA